LHAHRERSGRGGRDVISTQRSSSVITSSKPEESLTVHLYCFVPAS
jgi:hypothetical protein